MNAQPTSDTRFAVLWTRAILGVFALLGLGFGSWLSRLPAVRDHLGASTFEMSLFGLVLALGSLLGLAFSGRTVTLLGPRTTLTVGIIGQAIAMPLAGVLFWVGVPVPAAACLALFGIMFSTSDVAMNVSGAEAERALGKPRMSLFHAAFSLGSVSAMGLGALAERFSIPVPIHLAVIFACALTGVLLALRAVPHASLPLPATQTAQSAQAPLAQTSESVGIASVHTGPTPVVAPQPTGAVRGYSPWRDPRILVIGLIAMSMSLAEGTASDWLPLALTDGRGFANDVAALTLGAFFISITLTRVAGSWLLPRFGRVTVLRGGAVLVILGVSLTILVPVAGVSVVGAVLWGIGCAFGFPLGISAAADNPKTAVRDVAAVSAIAYTAFLLGPMIIGFLGEHIGLLQAFWPLIAFALFVLVFAGTAREPQSRTPGSDTH